MSHSNDKDMKEAISMTMLLALPHSVVAAVELQVEN